MVAFLLFTSILKCVNVVKNVFKNMAVTIHWKGGLMVQATQYIGQTVQVKIDRPLGSKHPRFGFEYPVNYGYVPDTKSGDGEELDAYVLIEDKPLKEYVGRCIAVIHRIDDDDDKLIVVPEAYDLADEEIEKEVAFQEKWFKHILLRG